MGITISGYESASGKRGVQWVSDNGEKVQLTQEQINLLLSAFDILAIVQEEAPTLMNHVFFYIESKSAFNRASFESYFDEDEFLSDED